MKTLEDAKKLAKTMVDIGKSLNKDVKAEVTDMDQPLGYAVGNNLEIKEVIETLHGRGPKDLYNLCLDSGSIMLVQAKIFKDTAKAREALIENINNGKAFEKFVEFIKWQHGDVSYLYHPEKFIVAKNIIPVYSLSSGYVTHIDALNIGISSMRLGGGRETLDDVIDMSAGIVLNKKLGDEVKKGELLMTLYTNKNDYQEVLNKVKEAFTISDKPFVKTEKRILIG